MLNRSNQEVYDVEKINTISDLETWEKAFM